MNIDLTPAQIEALNEQMGASGLILGFKVDVDDELAMDMTLAQITPGTITSIAVKAIPVE